MIPMAYIFNVSKTWSWTIQLFIVRWLAAKSMQIIIIIIIPRDENA